MPNCFSRPRKYVVKRCPSCVRERTQRYKHSFHLSTVHVKWLLNERFDVICAGAGLLPHGLVSQISKVAGRIPGENRDPAGPHGQHDEGNGCKTGERRKLEIPPPLPLFVAPHSSPLPPSSRRSARSSCLFGCVLTRLVTEGPRFNVHRLLFANPLKGEEYNSASCV